MLQQRHASSHQQCVGVVHFTSCTNDRCTGGGAHLTQHTHGVMVTRGSSDVHGGVAGLVLHDRCTPHEQQADALAQTHTSGRIHTSPGRRVS